MPDGKMKDTGASSAVSGAGTNVLLNFSIRSIGMK